MFHHYFRKVAPFLYTRNWYTGSFDISPTRCVVFGIVLLAVVIAVAIIITMGKPIVYRAYQP
jgi:hypothetical protein